jgi:hypothetical protein
MIVKRWWLVILLATPLMAQQPQQPLGQKPPDPPALTVTQLALENAQLRLQIAQLKEQMLTMQYQLVQAEKNTAQHDVEEAQRSVAQDKAKEHPQHAKNELKQ